jgi:hypothetical protein
VCLKLWKSGGIRGKEKTASQLKDTTTTILFSLAIKMPGFFEKLPLSGAEKHPDFQVTL